MVSNHPLFKGDSSPTYSLSFLEVGVFSPKTIKAKSGKEKDSMIYFFLDDSGSMRPYARMFQGLLEASRHVVNVYTGS